MGLYPGSLVPSALVWSAISQVSLHRDSVDHFLPTAVLEGLVPMPEFPFPLKAARRLPNLCTPCTFEKALNGLPRRVRQVLAPGFFCPPGPGRHYSTGPALFQGLFSVGILALHQVSLCTRSATFLSSNPSLNFAVSLFNFAVCCFTPKPECTDQQAAKDLIVPG